ncbi:MAG: hypothetical protein R3E89_05740 [Thiolinea sp.]
MDAKPPWHKRRLRNSRPCHLNKWAELEQRCHLMAQPRPLVFSELPKTHPNRKETTPGQEPVMPPTGLQRFGALLFLQRFDAL